LKKEKKINLDKRNYIILLIGIGLITIGYLTMKTGDHTISPIILIIAYCVVVPLALLAPSKKK